MLASKVLRKNINKKEVKNDLLSKMADLKNRIDFNGSYNESTGEPETILPNGMKVSYRSTGWTKNMKLVLFPKGYIEVSGSLHKHYNDGNQSSSGVYAFRTN